MIPTPHLVRVRRYVGATEDSHGNETPAWADPEALQVHGLAPGAMEEPEASSRDLSIIVWTLYAPAGTVVGPRDLIIVAGREYTVEGEVKDWTQGPWVNPVAGVVIELKRAEG